MSDARSVVVRLTGDVGGFVGSMGAAGASVTGFEAKAAAAARGVSGHSRSMIKSFVGVGTALAGLSVVGLIKNSIGLEQAYSKSLRLIGVATGETGKGLQQLDKLAQQMGADTVFSANEAADAMLNLAKGGLSSAEIQAGALANTLTLATAGNLELSDAADTVVRTMGAFDLTAEQSGRAVAALAGAANSSSASVDDIAQALAQAGTEAHAAGLSVEETTGILASFADAGIKGSDAGTSLKTMLGLLVPQTDKARTAMQKYGLDFVKTNGEFVNATQLAQQLKDGLGELPAAERSAALSAIFGSDARRAANVLTREGADGLQDYIKETSNLKSAQKLADAAMGGTSGALDQLQGAVETAELAIGRGLAPTVVDISHKLTDFLSSHDIQGGVEDLVGYFDDLFTSLQPLASSALPVLIDVGGEVADVLRLAADAAGVFGDAFGSLPDGVQRFAVELGLAFAAIGPLRGALAGFTAPVAGFVGGLRSAETRMATLKTAAGGLAGVAGLAALADSASRTGGALSALESVGGGAALGFSVGGLWGAAIGGGIGLLQAFGKANQAASGDIAALTATLDQQTGALTENSTRWAASKLADAGMIDDVAELGLSARDVTQAMLGNADAIAKVNGVLDTYIGKNKGSVSTSGYSSDQFNHQARAAEDLKKVISDTNGVVDEATSQQQFYADAMRKTADVMAGGGHAVDEFGRRLGPVADALTGSVTETSAALREDAEAAQQALVAHNALADAMLAGVGGQIGFRNAVREATAAAKEAAAANKGALDIFDKSAEGDALLTQLTQVAGAWNQLPRGIQNANGQFENARHEFIKVAMAMDVPREKARALARQWLDFPKKPAELNVKADTKNAVRDLGAVRNEVRELDGSSAEPKATADVRSALFSIADAGKALNVFGRSSGEGKATADVRSALSSIQTAAGKLADLDHSSANPPANLADHATAAINAVRSNLQSLDGDHAETSITNTTTNIINTVRKISGSLPGNAGGGPIYGPGSKTSDDVLMWGSNGEFMQRAASVDKYGIDAQYALNSLRPNRADVRAALGLPAFADGGLVGSFHVGGIPAYAGGGPIHSTTPGSATSLADVIERLIRGDLPATLETVAKAFREMRAEAKDVAAAEREVKAAREDSRDAAHRLADSNRAVSKTERDLDKARGEEHKSKAEISRLEKQLERQRDRVKKQTKEQRDADKELEQAEKALGKQRQQAAKANAAWQQELQELMARAQQVADAVSSTGAAFGGDGTSNTAAGFLAKLTGSVDDAQQFKKLVARLRAQHLNPGVLDQILDEGPTEAGLGLARSIANSPDLLRQINAQYEKLGALAGSIGGFAIDDKVRRRGDKRLGVGAGGFTVNFNGPITTHDIRAAGDEIEKRFRHAQRMAARR